MSNKYLYYGSAGDSGIIALDEQGNYHLVTKKQNDDIGRVYSIPTNRLLRLVRQTSSLRPSCVWQMGYTIPLHPSHCGTISFLSMCLCKYVRYVCVRFGKYKEPEAVENCKNALIKYLQSDECKTMTDDLSVAALINTNSDLQKEDIKWEEPQIDFYSLKWDEVSLYPSTETRNNLFKAYIREKIRIGLKIRSILYLKNMLVKKSQIPIPNQNQMQPHNPNRKQKKNLIRVWNLQCPKHS